MQLSFPLEIWGKKWEGRKEKDEKKDNWMTKLKCQEVKTQKCFNKKNLQMIKSEVLTFLIKQIESQSLRKILENQQGICSTWQEVQQ